MVAKLNPGGGKPETPEETPETEAPSELACVAEGNQAYYYDSKRGYSLEFLVFGSTIEQLIKLDSPASPNTFTFKLDQDLSDNGGIFLVIEASEGQSNGVSRAHSKAVAIKLVEEPDDTAINIAADYVAKHGAPSAAAPKIFFRYYFVNSSTGEEVPYDRLVKGYEIAPDRYVVITQEELDSLDPVRARTIEIEDFVDGAEIEEVIMGNVLTAGQGQNPARQAMLAAGLRTDGLGTLMFPEINIERGRAVQCQLLLDGRDRLEVGAVRLEGPLPPLVDGDGPRGLTHHPDDSPASRADPGERSDVNCY